MLTLVPYVGLSAAGPEMVTGSALAVSECSVLVLSLT